MDYSELFAQSWRIIWRFKWLWLFGLLASCGRASGSGSQSHGSNGSSGLSSAKLFSALFADLPRWLQGLETAWQKISAGEWVILAALGLLMVSLILVIHTVGRAGLARGAWLADDGALALPLSRLWREMTPCFWRVFGLHLLLLLGALTLAAFVAIAVITFGFATLGIGLLLLGIPLICGMVIFIWLLAVLQEQATAAIVGENLVLVDALQRAWGVMQRHPGPMVVLSLVFFLGGGVVRGLFALPFIVVLLPAVVGFVIGGQAAIGAGLGMAGLLLLVYLPVFLALTGALQSYIGTGWVLAFRRLTGLLPLEGTASAAANRSET